jgi:hypothetical protein
VAVKAYASYKPELALKYVKNVLVQYAKDGLAFQRYGRTRQDGLGDDILSGNSLAVVGLYQAIYGINPKYNRFYLDPHITKELAGTRVRYNYRDQQLAIDLDMNKYAVSNSHFKIMSKTDFGFFSRAKELLYFNHNTDKTSLKVTTMADTRLILDIKKWGIDEISLTQFSNNVTSSKLIYQINDLKHESYYTILLNNKILKRIKSDKEGSLIFSNKATKDPSEIVVLNK